MITPSKTMTGTFPYQIEAKIGAGGMGVVFRAFEPALNRRVAIKVLRAQILEDEKPEVADEYRRRFMQEARAAAALSHPGATTIFRIGEEDGLPFIAMEWLDGQTLEQIASQEGQLAPSRVARIGVDLLDTLEAAHRAGVVHRDVKPANLILLNDGRLKVTDFGIARVADSDLVKTGAGAVLATPQYASPEQLQGEDVDGRADVFSTGVVLYLLLSGKFPWAGANFFELMAALARGEATPIRQYCPGLDPAIERAVMTALRRDRTERFASAAQMADVLRPLLSGESPDSSVTRALLAQAEADAEAAETIRDSSPAKYPTLTGMPRCSRMSIVRIVESWPSRNLGTVQTSILLARLLERPLHAPPFAGGAFIGGYCVLIFGGFILGAVDFSGRSHDEVCEQLPEEASVVIHTIPPDMPCSLIPMMASLLHEPKYRLNDLDTSLVNLPALSRKLSTEHFDGILTLERGEATGAIFFDQGQPALSMFSDGWEELPVENTWESWASRESLKGTLLEKVWKPAHLSYRRELRDYGFWVAAPQDETKRDKLKQVFIRKTSNLTDESTSGERKSSGRLTPVRRPDDSGDLNALASFYKSDPAYRFLTWALDELPAYFQERGRTSSWKYLAGWIPLIRRAVLHHNLPRPDGNKSDFFDLVTYDSSDKVLHIGHRVPRGTPEALAEFVGRVVEAKRARTKTGDVGGAFLLAPTFDESMIEAYQEQTRPQGTGLLAVEEKLTKYEGFIRMGPRRGFHLLLVVEKGDSYEPILLV
ncbi:MAG: serine/threonine protein kinase [Blastocatellia bacterium]|nr:serine/threonine protein kinase [Blastocatellia bacterium]